MFSKRFPIGMNIFQSQLPSSTSAATSSRPPITDIVIPSGDNKCPGCQLKHRALILRKSDKIQSIVWCRQTTRLASCSPQLTSSFLIDSLDHLAPVGVGPSCNKDKPASQSSSDYLHPHKRKKWYEESLLSLLCASHCRFVEQASSRIEPQQKRPDQRSHRAPATVLDIIRQYSTSKNHPSQTQAHVLGRGHRTGSP